MTIERARIILFDYLWKREREFILDARAMFKILPGTTDVMIREGKLDNLICYYLDIEN